MSKQADIDKILKVIQRKVLKGTHLLVEIKKIQAGYLKSSHFKDIYLYLTQNTLPTSKTSVRKVEMVAERYILLDSLLFKITPEKELAVLAVPETCTDKIIILYHSSLFAGHQGVIKTYLTISNKVFIPNLIHYHRCHICQLASNEKPPARQLQTRINPNYIPLSRLSMDLKVMPRSHKGHKYILCIIDEVTNYLITVPIYKAESEEMGETITENVITNYCIPEYIIMDQDSGNLVYIISPLTRQLHTASHKVGIKYKGPVVIYKIIDPHNYLLMTLDGRILRGTFEHERLKPANIRMSQGNFQNLAQLKQIINAGLKFH